MEGLGTGRDGAASVVVIGAGQAGYAVARDLRGASYTGAITLIGDEAHPPYERPPLSKSVLLGEQHPSATYLTDAQGLAAQRIDWIQAHVAAVHPVAHEVTISDGRTIPYDKLVFATGGRPRRLSLPGADLDGIYYLRDIADAAAIRAYLVDQAHVVIIGGGWIGLEVAASARKSGATVTVVEALPKLCARSLPDPVAAFVLALHHGAGVEVLLDRGVRGFAGQGRVEAVELDDGQILPADIVIAGIGMIPNAELARDAGIDVASGIIVNEDGRTSIPGIFAAGDVAETLRHGKLVRAESWANANEQAAEVAAAIAGAPRPQRPPPWFWSDQHDTNIQMLGALPPDGCAAEPVVLGDASSGAISWVYLDGDRLVAVISANRPRDVQAGKRIMMRNMSITAADLHNVGDLSHLLRKTAS